MPSLGQWVTCTYMYSYSYNVMYTHTKWTKMDYGTATG